MTLRSPRDSVRAASPRRPQRPRGGRRSGTELARQQAIDDVEIVGGQDDQDAARLLLAQPATSAAADAWSSPVNGSSSRISRGWCSSARSSATRWRMPREKPDDRSCGALAEAGPLERAQRPSGRRRPRRTAGRRTSGSRARSARDRETGRDRACRSARGARRRPSAVSVPYSTRPSDGVSRVARMASSVDLPAPFGPSRPTIRRLAGESDLRQRLAAAVVTRQGGDREALEVVAHAAAPWPPPGRLVERRQHPLELGDQRRPRARRPWASASRRGGAPRWPPARASGAPAPPPASRARGVRRPARTRDQAGQHDESGAADREPARRHVVRRQVRDLNDQLCPRGQAPPLPRMNTLPPSALNSPRGSAAATASACRRSSRPPRRAARTPPASFCRM